MASRPGTRFFIAAWWFLAACTGLWLVVFSRDYLPAKFTLDAAIVDALLASADLWDGMSFDSYTNTARFWSLVFEVLPPVVVIPLFYAGLAAATVRVLHVAGVHEVRYHVLAGGWLVCSAIFLSFPNKELIALPVALWLCLAPRGAWQVAATLVFLAYAAFFRQYWAICFFYFLAMLFALRLHRAGHGGYAVIAVLVAYALPFIAADAVGFQPLTDARDMVNADRVDSPDARSAFNNTFANTGFATDMANAAIAWAYMNVPVALLARTSPQYIFFAAFQLLSLWFFAAGFGRFLRDARRIGHGGSVYPRCCAFVVAYSMTQSIFEPDFGSFLRHEVVVMIPMLVVVFYRAHASRAPETRPMGLAYGRNLTAHV